MPDHSMIADEYSSFATREAAPTSALYAELASGVAGDPDLLALLATLPPAKQQPNLLFAAARRHCGQPASYSEFRAGVLDEWATVSAIMLVRRTQTNEPARCAGIYPVLASLPQPVALLEVGASAGLCLYPERYRYEYNGRVAGDERSPVRLRTTVEGEWRHPGPVQVAWRAGVDLNPLSVTDADDVDWLKGLVWPGEEERLSWLEPAIEIARRDPPSIVAGDLNEHVLEVAAQAPASATLVVFHTAVLGYLSAVDVERFAEQVRTLRGHWISQEVPATLPWIPVQPDEESQPLRYVVALDEQPIARTLPHGGWMRIIAPVG
jgi:hypothetical protein